MESSSRPPITHRRTEVSSDNPPNGGPADTDVTHWIENRANEVLKRKNADVRRLPFAKAIKAPTPVNSSAGNAIKLPPPATAFMALIRRLQRKDGYR